MTRKMTQITPNQYNSEDGWVLQREYGFTPHGNPIEGRWVLRDHNGDWVNFGRYRNDLACEHGLDLHGNLD